MTDDFTLLDVSEEPLHSLFKVHAKTVKHMTLDSHGRYIPGWCYDPYLTRKVIGINGGEDTLFVVIK